MVVDKRTILNENRERLHVQWTAKCGNKIDLIGQFWLSSRNFFRGAKSILMQISFVMLLFSDQISGKGKSFQGSKLLQGGTPVEES